MARRKRASANDQPIGVGLTTKQMKRKKPLSSSYLVDIDPLNDNQKRLIAIFEDNSSYSNELEDSENISFNISLFNSKCFCSARAIIYSILCK